MGFCVVRAVRFVGLGFGVVLVVLLVVVGFWVVISLVVVVVVSVVVVGCVTEIKFILTGTSSQKLLRKNFLPVKLSG